MSAALSLKFRFTSWWGWTQSGKDETRFCIISLRQVLIHMEQVIELGNMPALKIHVQVVKKVDSVFKVGLPLAKWLYCICSIVIEWTSNCLLNMIHLKMLIRHYYSTEAWQRRLWGGDVGPLHPDLHEGPHHKVLKTPISLYFTPKFYALNLKGEKFQRQISHLMSHTPRQSLLAWHEESKVV